MSSELSALFPLRDASQAFPEKCYQPTKPSAAVKPRLLLLNHKLAEQLALSEEALSGPEGLSMLSGASSPESVTPVAMAYSGHQFGFYNPLLGDGRACLLGQIIGADQHLYDLQLKGSGQTPFSRRGDGRSPIGPVLREYIVSEAMHALGVPTTRSLSACLTGENVWRESGVSAGAVLMRVARSHLRVGSFQYHAHRGNTSTLNELIGWCLQHLYPEAERGTDPVFTLFNSVVRAQAHLIAKWMSLGFIHGVMNTDNMSISGETIDYGPCAFMEEFRSDQVFSFIDEQGRYAYQNQPQIGHWNLARLVESLAEAYENPEEGLAVLSDRLTKYPDLYQAEYDRLMAHKIGLQAASDASRSLVSDFLNLLEIHEVDFTLGFRFLADELEGKSNRFRQLFSPLASAELEAWLVKWRASFEIDGEACEERILKMNQVNPIKIPRNHLVERAISHAQEGDMAFCRTLIGKLTDNPYQDDGHEMWITPASYGEKVSTTFCGT